MNQTLISIITTLAYLVIVLWQSVQLQLERGYHRVGYRLGSLIVLGLHGWLLYHWIDTPLGQDLNGLLMLSFTLWLLNILILITSLASSIENLVVFTYPITAITIPLVITLAKPQLTLMTKPILVHLLLGFFAISLLLLASFQSILLGWQHYLLKQHSPSRLVNVLPSIQSMERLLFQILWSGLVTLSLVFITGFTSGDLLNTSLSKIVFAILAWALFALVLFGRYGLGWRGLIVMRWTLVGTLFILIAYFGNKLLA